MTRSAPRVVLPVTLFVLNLFLVLPLLTGSGHVSPSTGFPGSEVGGVTGPLVPLLASAVRALGVPGALADALLGALAFAFVAAGMGVLARALTGRPLAGWLTGFAVTLLPATVFAVPDLTHALADATRFAPGVFLTAASGHLAQLVGLAALPWVALVFRQALVRPGRGRMVGAALAGTALLLTGTGAATSMLLLGAVITFAEVLRTYGSGTARVRTALSIALLTLAFATPWYTPAFWTTFWTRGEGRAALSADLGLLPFAIVLAPWLLIGLFYLFGFRRHVEALFIGWAWFTLLAGVLLLGSGGGRDLVPFATRLIPELDLAAALTFGALATAFFDWVGRVEGTQHRLTRVFQGSLLVGIVLSLVGYTAGFWRGSWAYLRSLPADTVTLRTLGIGHTPAQVGLGLAIAAAAVVLVVLPKRSRTAPQSIASKPS